MNLDFIVIEAYSPYMAILARLWLYTIWALSSILHVKLKYPTKGGVGELLGCQVVARQCMVAGTKHLKSVPRSQFLPHSK